MEKHEKLDDDDDDDDDDDEQRYSQMNIYI